MSVKDGHRQDGPGLDGDGVAVSRVPVDPEQLLGDGQVAGGADRQPLRQTLDEPEQHCGREAQVSATVVGGDREEEDQASQRDHAEQEATGSRPHPVLSRPLERSCCAAVLRLRVPDGHPAAGIRELGGCHDRDATTRTCPGRGRQVK